VSIAKGGYAGNYYFHDIHYPSLN